MRFPRAAPIASSTDRYLGTTARILGGVNGSALTDGGQRPLTKAVDTGWSPATRDTASNVLRLWGMTDIATTSSDVYSLSLSYDFRKVDWMDLLPETFALAAQDKHGNWVNAVSLNSGG